jgi:hypothetical protein
MLRPPVLFTAPFTVGARAGVTIDKPIQLSTEGNQDNCELGIFTFRFTGSATRAGTGGSNASRDRAGHRASAPLPQAGSAVPAARSGNSQNWISHIMGSR